MLQNPTPPSSILSAFRDSDFFILSDFENAEENEGEIVKLFNQTETEIPRIWRGWDVC